MKDKNLFLYNSTGDKSEPYADNRAIVKAQSDFKILMVLYEITSRGNNAEVRQRKDGTLQVYEVKKNIVAVGQ